MKTGFFQQSHGRRPAGHMKTKGWAHFSLLFSHSSVSDRQAGLRGLLVVLAAKDDQRRGKGLPLHTDCLLSAASAFTAFNEDDGHGLHRSTTHSKARMGTSRGAHSGDVNSDGLDAE